MHLPAWTRFFTQRNESKLISKDTGSRSYYMMLASAAGIATLGLLLDNATVIIGAMLISPLMVPLLSLAVSIERGKWESLLNSLVHLSLSISVVIIVSILTVFLLPVAEIPQQALLRANPNLLDLLIAIVAGVAGMYAFLHKDVPESLVGIAISVSLVPPLCVVGMGIALQNIPLSLGSVVLFVTNVIAIQCAAVAMLFLHGRRAQGEEAKKVAVVSTLATVVMAVLFAVLLGSLFISEYRQEQRKVTVSDVLEEQFKKIDGTVTELTVREREGKTSIHAVVRLPEDQEAPSIESLNSALVFALEDSVDFELSLIRIQRGTKQITTEDQEEIQQFKEDNPAMTAEQATSSSTVPKVLIESTATSSAEASQSGDSAASESGSLE